MNNNKRVLLLIYGIGRSTHETHLSINCVANRLRSITSDLKIVYFRSLQNDMNSARTKEFGCLPSVPKGIFNEDIR